jgi:hypothetical protein
VGLKLNVRFSSFENFNSFFGKKETTMRGNKATTITTTRKINNDFLVFFENSNGFSTSIIFNVLRRHSN